MKSFFVMAGLLASISASASSRYIYFMIDEGFSTQPRVYNLEMDSLYRYVTGYTNGRGAGQVTCGYKTTTGDNVQVFSIGYDSCGEETLMSLDFSMGESSSSYEALFADHKSLFMSGRARSGGSEVSMAVMSATLYQKAQKLSAHDPRPLPSIDQVPSVIRNDDVNPDHNHDKIAPGVVTCALSFQQQLCQSPR